MALLRILLLVLGVAGAIARPFRWPAWVAPVACALADLAVGGIALRSARAAVDPLRAPIGFLLAAVPLAVLLDQLGFFTSLADVVIRFGRGSGGLWVLAALVTTVLNLDAAVVLLTPLYVRIARQTGRSPIALAFQPVLLACLASSALPVSNLTNLIATSWTGVATIEFVTHMAIPSLVATAVGWWRYRRVLDPDRDSERGPTAEPEGRSPTSGVEHRRALTIGGIVVAGVLAGFLAGGAVGLAPWMVALAADLALIAVSRRLPWPAIPWGTALIAGSLAVLAAAAVAHVAVDRVVGGHGTLALTRTIGASGVAANVVNNLPALLVALPAVGHHAGPTLWAVLLGVNMGPVVLVTGSLASLLWLDAVGRLGVTISAREFSRIGVRVGLPAALAGAAVLVAMLATFG